MEWEWAVSGWRRGLGLLGQGLRTCLLPRLLSSQLLPLFFFPFALALLLFFVGCLLLGAAFLRTVGLLLLLLLLLLGRYFLQHHTLFCRAFATSWALAMRIRRRGRVFGNSGLDSSRYLLLFGSPLRDECSERVPLISAPGHDAGDICFLACRRVDLTESWKHRKSYFTCVA